MGKLISNQSMSVAFSKVISNSVSLTALIPNSDLSFSPFSNKHHHFLQRHTDKHILELSRDQPIPLPSVNIANSSPLVYSSDHFASLFNVIFVC